MLRQALEVLLLLGESLLELKELLLLALANGVVLGGALAALEGVTVRSILSEYPKSRLIHGRQRPFPRIESFAYPWPPVLRGAPVSPSAMARAVVEKAAARMGRRAAVLAKVVRSIVGERGGVLMGDWFGDWEMVFGEELVVELG